MASVKITNKKDMFVWRIQLDKLKKNMKVEVENGLVALCYLNGKFVNQFSSCDGKILNEGNALGKMVANPSVIFYVFNSSAEMEVRWGVGKMPVTYIDKQLGSVPVGITAYGCCKMRVMNAKLLLDKLPRTVSNDGVIESEDLVSNVQRDIMGKVGSLLGAGATKIGDYRFLQARIDELSDVITIGLGELSLCGLRVMTTIIEGIEFTEESKAKYPSL